MREEKQSSRQDTLAASTEMKPVAGTVEVNIPVAVLWQAFRHADWWARWNRCFFWAWNRDLLRGQKLIWAFQPIRWWYLYKMLEWATAEKNICWVYQRQTRANTPRF